MLSKKMAFSLMSLIIVFALALVVSPAIAANFKVKIEGDSLVIPADTSATEVTAQVILTSDQDMPDDIDTKFTYYVRDEDGVAMVGAKAAGDGGSPPARKGYHVTENENTDYAGRTARKRQFNIVIQLTDGILDTGGFTAEATSPRQVADVVLTVPSFETPDPAVADADDASDAVNFAIAVRQAASTDTSSRPKVVSIQRLRPGSQTVVSAFEEQRIPAEPFHVRIVLSEARAGIDVNKPKDFLEVANAEVSGLTIGRPFAQQLAASNDPDTSIVPHPIEGRYAFDAVTAARLAGTPLALAPVIPVPAPSGDDNMYHQYRVTITPHVRKAEFDVTIHVKAFNDGDTPYPNWYQPIDVNVKPNGREQLRLTVIPQDQNLKAGYRVTIPKDVYIPGSGYLVIAQNVAGSEIEAGPGPAGAWRTNDPPRATHRTPAQLLYNVIGNSDLPNLATQFVGGVVVDVESSNALIISEVMWGEDASLNPNANSQYIELYNAGGGFKTPDDDLSTPDIDERLTLVFYAPNEFTSLPAATGRVTDRIGTLDATGAHWSVINKGQSGRSGTGEAESIAGRVAVATTPIVSMYRVMDATGTVQDGQMAANWASSQGPKSVNFDLKAAGIRHGTPGAATDATVTPADTEAEAKAKADAAAAAAKAAADKLANTGTYPMQGDGRIYISEVMFAGGGTLPQWIEIANGDRAKEFNLSGWTLTVDNATADADVAVSSATFTIPNGTTISPSAQDDTPSTILVVTERGRNNFNGAIASGQVINLAVDNEIDLINAGILRGKYALLSDMAFLITLAPPVPAATKAPAGETSAAKAQRQAAEKKASAERKAAMDMAGNLGKDGTAAWALPMNEGGARSSIIRKHIQVTRGPAAPEDGMMAENWTLASNTSFAQVTHIRVQSYYGAANDVGTPGFRAGGALPVELSHFRPARDKATGAAVITWATESELNNAGFFIKRSQQRNGEFKVINATMVPGAGTTSEKQFYTYTDTTAQPNVVYYYQIEDVSLDGNRQTLTRGIRLKGHVGAAGKATTLWGELKTSHE